MLLKALIAMAVVAVFSSPAMAERIPKNALGAAASPYLRMHKDDPVHWQEWSEAVLETARQSGRPIFLSIGYSACHWCHVMQAESFADAETAAMINRLFVPVLVDREERPDLDDTYQRAVAQMEGISGWPLNVFLTPDGAPYFGGVYFPPERELGMPAFREVLVAAADAWARDRARVDLYAGAVLDRLSLAPKPAEVTPAGVDAAARTLLGRMDALSGGFGTAPKYPSVPQLEAVWRYGLRRGDAQALDAVSFTLTRMLQGGLYDHLGGGFARYAVDPDWRVPHFEKMLYANAQLLRLMTLVWQRTGLALLRARIYETVAFLQREMMLTGGVFAASLDSDSDGREGAYYVWDAEEIDRVLGEDATLFKLAYGVETEGNWDGANILYRTAYDIAELAAATGRPPGEIGPALESARRRLADARQARVRPFRDDKAIAGWNGLTISALSLAGRAFAEPDWIRASERALAQLEDRLIADDGTVRRYWIANAARGTATASDLGSLAEAAFVLFEATGKPAYRARAEGLVRQALERLWDSANGGFFLSAATADLPLRSKAMVDGEVPAGSAVIAEVIAKLAYLTGDTALRSRAVQAVTAAGAPIAVDAFPFASHLNAADTLLRGVQIVVVGARGEADTDALVRAVWHTSVPSRVFSVVAPGEVLPEGHPARFKGQVEGRPTAYVCIGQVCSYPLVTPEALRRQLDVGWLGPPRTPPSPSTALD